MQIGEYGKKVIYEKNGFQEKNKGPEAVIEYSRTTVIANTGKNRDNIRKVGLR